MATFSNRSPGRLVAIPTETYNLTRVMNIVGIRLLIAAIAA